MKLATIRSRGRVGPAIVLNNGGAFATWTDDCSLPMTMLDLIRSWDEVKSRVQAGASTVTASPEDVELMAPIPRPARDIICIGKNYHDHAREFGSSGYDSTADTDLVPKDPVIFTKSAGSVIGPNQPIPIWHDPTETVDYEGELAVIIGPGGRQISAGDAPRHVFGYTILNDVTSRTLQKRHQQWFIGKGIDGFCPLGPWIVTTDEFGSVSSSAIETFVNGERRQTASFNDLIFDIPYLIKSISSVITLEAGDIIATGTPAGVGIGFSPPRFLRDNDVVQVSVAGIGSLQNTCSSQTQ